MSGLDGTKVIRVRERVMLAVLRAPKLFAFGGSSGLKALRTKRLNPRDFRCRGSSFRSHNENCTRRKPHDTLGDGSE